jgi:hypothetical protein
LKVNFGAIHTLSMQVISPVSAGFFDLPILADRCKVGADRLLVGGHLPGDRDIVGNFSQTYLMSGVILTATKLSWSWGDRFWRGSS